MSTLTEAIDAVNEKLATIEDELDEDLPRLEHPDDEEEVDADEWARENTEPAVERVKALHRTPDTDAFTNVANTIESINPEIRDVEARLRERYD